MTNADVRFAIGDLFAHYEWALDTGDVEAFADLFVDDALIVFDAMGARTHYEGRTGLIDFAERLRVWDRFPGCQHHGGQPVVEFADEGRCRVRSFVFVAECRGEPPYLLRFNGRRDDVLVRRDGRWLFERRVLRLWRGGALCIQMLEAV